MAASAAACPVYDDLASGVRLDYADGSYSNIFRDPDGALREVEYDGDDIYTYYSDNGLLETGYEESGREGQDRFEYTFDTSSLLPVKPWSGLQGEQVTTYADGGETERVGFSYHTRGKQPFAVGGCSYSSIAVQTHYDFEDGRTMVEFAYLMELGVPIAVGYWSDGGYDRYQPISISKVTE